MWFFKTCVSIVFLVFSFFSSWLPWGSEVVLAATFTVNSFGDSGDATPGNNLCQTWPGYDNCTLRAAIMESNELAGADTIILPAGTYILNIPGIAEDAAYSGDLDINSSLTIKGAGMSTTVVDANAIDRVFDLIGDLDMVVSLSNLTIKGGDVATGNQGGAGIRLWNGSLLLDNVAIINNTVHGTASGDTGGALKNIGNSCEIKDAKINNNSADRGGAMFSNSSISVERTLFSGNSSRSGGSMLNYGTATFVNTTFSDNTAASSGGALYNAGGATTTLLQVTIANNSVTGPGLSGGIANVSGGTVNMTNTIIADNTNGNCNGSGTFTSGGGNLENTDTCNMHGPKDLINTDPQLADLADNGGASQTHALLAGSPAIDAGIDQPLITVDQRGKTRPQGKGYDKGAFEYSAFPWIMFLPRHKAN